MKREDSIRKEILMQLYALRPFTASPERIQRDASKAGYDYTVAEVKRELSFLNDQGLVIEIGDPGVTARLYRIHAQGITHYEQNL